MRTRKTLGWGAFACGLVAFVSLGVLPAAEYRQFPSNDGKLIEAKLVSVDGDEVTILVKRGGKETVVPMTRFSAADQEFIRSQPEDAPAAVAERDAPKVLDPAEINAAIGHKVFDEASVWSTLPEAVASRLGWPEESRTPRQSSYRSYAESGYRFLGARPYSASLYGTGGKVTSLSLVYANKGDLFSSAGGGEAHFERGEPMPKDPLKRLQKAMENDEEKISEALTALLEEPERQQYGEGKARQRVSRWDWQGHAFLLSALDDEYVSLQIVPSEMADSGGKSRKVSDASVRERIRANVETRDNGDVVISNLPMVDQGPKGYCVPATFERCMRYLDVPADMYILAMAGQSGIGGGTSVELLIKGIERDVKRKGRRFEKLGGRDLKMSRLVKVIDDGIPVVWSMCSTDWFNETANARTAERSEISDWSEWALRMKAAEKEAKGRDQADSNHHVVIIIGYNKETGEIAFSDSWGNRYTERWITLAEAATVSSDRLYVIRL